MFFAIFLNLVNITSAYLSTYTLIFINHTQFIHQQVHKNNRKSQLV